MLLISFSLIPVVTSSIQEFRSLPGRYHSKTLLLLLLLLLLLSSSTITLWLLSRVLPPGNHLPISFAIFLYFFSLQVCNLNFLGSMLSSILCICSLQSILYCVNLSLILKMPNCSLMSVLLFVQKCISFRWSYKSNFSSFNLPLSDRFRDQFSLPYMKTETGF